TRCSTSSVFSGQVSISDRRHSHIGCGNTSDFDKGDINRLIRRLGDAVALACERNHLYVRPPTFDGGADPEERHVITIPQEALAEKVFDQRVAHSQNSRRRAVTEVSRHPHGDVERYRHLNRPYDGNGTAATLDL